MFELSVMTVSFCFVCCLQINNSAAVLNVYIMYIKLSIHFISIDLDM
jgi:hypothetical protein